MLQGPNLEIRATSKDELLGYALIEIATYLLAYSPMERGGVSRTRVQILNQDCSEVFTTGPQAWIGYTFENVAQWFPDECDDLQDSTQSEMHRTSGARC